MGIYIYCLGEEGHPPPERVQGLDGTAVRAVSVAGFSAWASDLERQPSASLETIRAHNRVVEEAVATATPLPLRFGQWFDTMGAMRASLQEQRDQLAAGLDRVRNRLEFGVRVLDPAYAAEEPARESGKAYLEGLARRERRTEEGRQRGLQVAAEIEQWLGDLQRDSRVRPLGAEALASIAYLVDRHDTRSYKRRIQGFPDQRPELEFVFTGPWPPYGFVE